MPTPELDDRIISRGKALLAAIAGDKPSLFDSYTVSGRLLEWCLENEAFKTSLFRFVDVFPTLRGSTQLTGHIRQYFGAEEHLPPLPAIGVQLAGMLGPLGGDASGKGDYGRHSRDGPPVHHRREYGRAAGAPGKTAPRRFCRSGGRPGGGNPVT